MSPYSFLKDYRFWLFLIAGPLILWFCLLGKAELFGLWSNKNLIPIALFVIVYPVVEELAFRGAIQSYLLNKLQKKSFPISWANLITTILFCLIHLVARNTLAAVMVFFPSLIFGYVRERYTSVTPAIILHSVYNASFVALSLLAAP